MNEAIADIIRDYISDLSFIDKLAGLVKAVTVEMRAPDNTTVQKTFPVACCVTADDCKTGAYNDLVPDSRYKTVIYFEDRGTSFVRSQGPMKYYTSNLRLVCWININKITEATCKEENPCTYAAHLIVDIIRHLPTHPVNVSPFSLVYHEVVSEAIRSNDIFAAYSYDELHAQYLMSPYDYFALDIRTDFSICMSGRDVYDATCD